jgi:16S rRNA (cytidine1402-2'-O)-methyltransferase
VVGPPARARDQPAAADLDELLAEALASRPPAAAAAAVAAATGQPRRELYRRALALQGR